jgi:hypothetical protein
MLKSCHPVVLPYKILQNIYIGAKHACMCVGANKKPTWKVGFKETYINYLNFFSRVLLRLLSSHDPAGHAQDLILHQEPLEPLLPALLRPVPGKRKQSVPVAGPVK